MKSLKFMIIFGITCYPIMSNTTFRGGILADQVAVSGTSHTGDVSVPVVTASGTCLAQSAWVQDDGLGVQRAYAAEFTAEGWEVFATPISGAVHTGDAVAICVSIMAAESAQAVWIQDDGLGVNRVYASEFDGDNWNLVGTPISGAVHTGDVLNLELATSENETAQALWTQDDGLGVNRVYAAAFDGSDWVLDAAPVSGAVHTGDALNVRLNALADGTAHAVWEQDDGLGVNRIYAAQYNGTTWASFATPISGAAHTGNASTSELILDDAGNAHAVWFQDDGAGVNRIYGAEFNGTSWSTVSAPISGAAHTVDAVQPQVIIDDRGEVFTAWQQDDGIGVQRIYAAQLQQGSWVILPEPISGSSHSGDAVNVKLAQDVDGGVIAGWEETIGGVTRINAARFDPWVVELAAAPISGSTHLADATNLDLASDPAGGVFFVWQQADEFGVVRTFSARLIDIPSPSNVSGCQTLLRFPTQGDLINQLCWDPVIFENEIVKYNVYACVACNNTECSFENAALIGYVCASNKLQFCHHNRCCGQRVTYYITAVDNEGNESLSSEPFVI